MRVLCINTKPDISFFTKRGLQLDITYDTCSKIFPAIKSGQTTNTDGSSVTLYSPDVRQYLETTYKNTKYDVILFGWNPSDYGQEFKYSGGQTFRDALSNGSRFATVRQGTPNIEIHEMMHIIGNILYIDLKKYDAVDQMDATTINGKTYYYLKNEIPDSVDGNFAITWNSYKKYLPELNSLGMKTLSKTLKIGSTGTLVVQLQQSLRELGYFTYFANTGIFGQVTKNAVIAFQKANKLTPDGIAGSITLSKIEEKKTQNLNSLSKWKLTPECEHKAFQFLTIAKADGYNLKITQGRRTQAQQDALYAQGRTTKGKIVTNTRNSVHLTGNAFDFSFSGKDPYPDNFDWSILGRIGKQVGLKWGGDFKSFRDVLHFEL
jgi:peptidoglycan L-alanyl-D-glutamate endopeptidase CwlK